MVIFKTLEGFLIDFYNGTIRKQSENTFSFYSLVITKLNFCMYIFDLNNIFLKYSIEIKIMVN